MEPLEMKIKAFEGSFLLAVRRGNALKSFAEGEYLVAETPQGERLKGAVVAGRKYWLHFPGAYREDLEFFEPVKERRVAGYKLREKQPHYREHLTEQECHALPASFQEFYTVETAHVLALKPLDHLAAQVTRLEHPYREDLTLEELPPEEQAVAKLLWSEPTSSHLQMDVTLTAEKMLAWLHGEIQAQGLFWVSSELQESSYNTERSLLISYHAEAWERRRESVRTLKKDGRPYRDGRTHQVATKPQVASRILLLNEHAHEAVTSRASLKSLRSQSCVVLKDLHCPQGLPQAAAYLGLLRERLCIPTEN